MRVETADTDHGLDERITAGSTSIMDSGSALRQAAAEARAVLLERAAARLDAAPAALSVFDGTITEPTGMRRTSYWELSGGRPLERDATGRVLPKPAAEHRIVGEEARNRADLHAIVSGAARFVADLDHERLLHARIVRPPGPRARARRPRRGRGACAARRRRDRPEWELRRGRRRARGAGDPRRRAPRRPVALELAAGDGGAGDRGLAAIGSRARRS